MHTLLVVIYLVPGLPYPKQIDQALPFNLRDGEEA
jgi:hypothetical protein